LSGQLTVWGDNGSGTGWRGGEKGTQRGRDYSLNDGEWRDETGAPSAGRRKTKKGGKTHHKTHKKEGGYNGVGKRKA